MTLIGRTGSTVTGRIAKYNNSHQIIEFDNQTIRTMSFQGTKRAADPLIYCRYQEIIMREEIEKTEARQGERKRWQEHVLSYSLIVGGVALALALIIFMAITG